MIQNVLTSTSKCQPEALLDYILSSVQTKHQLLMKWNDMCAQIIWEIARRMRVPVLFINLVSTLEMPSSLSKMLNVDVYFSFLVTFLFASCVCSDKVTSCFPLTLSPFPFSVIFLFQVLSGSASPSFWGDMIDVHTVSRVCIPVCGSVHGFSSYCCGLPHSQSPLNPLVQNGVGVRGPWADREEASLEARAVTAYIK